jgi:hypothetical protein
MVLPAELGDALLEGFLERAERLENRFQWVNFLVFDCAEMRMVVESAASGGTQAYSTSSTRTRA